MARERFDAVVRSDHAGRTESDVRTASERWFRPDAHESVDEFVCCVPVAYFRFGMDDRYADSTSHEMQTLFRVLLLNKCHGWDPETVLVEYRSQRPDLCDRLGLTGSTRWSRRIGRVVTSRSMATRGKSRVGAARSNGSWRGRSPMISDSGSSTFRLRVCCTRSDAQLTCSDRPN